MVLAHIESKTPPQAGDKLYSADLGEQSGGAIVNAAAVPEGGFDVLAVVQTSSLGAVTVNLGSPTGPALQLLPMPYPLETKESPQTKPA